MFTTNTLTQINDYFSYTIMFSYNFRSGYALLSYMEYPIILAQELVLIYLVVHYKNLLGTNSFISAGVYFIIAFAFLFGYVPREFLMFCVVSATIFYFRSFR